MVAFVIGLHVLAGELIPQVLVLGAVFGVIAIVLRPQRRRLGLMSAGLALLALIGNAPFILEDLANPDGGWVFPLTMLSLLAAVAVIGGGMGMFFRWPDRPVVPVAAGLGGVLVFATLTSVVLSASQESDTPMADDVLLAAEGVVFVPGEVVITADASGVWVDNRDIVRHTWSVDELGIELELPPNTARRIDLDEVLPGEYEIYCDVPGHENMTATLIAEG